MDSARLETRLPEKWDRRLSERERGILAARLAIQDRQAEQLRDLELEAREPALTYSLGAAR